MLKAAAGISTPLGYFQSYDVEVKTDINLHLCWERTLRDWRLTAL